MMTTKQSPQASGSPHPPQDTVIPTSSNRGAFQRGFVLPSPTLIMAGVIIALSLSNVLFINLWQGAKDDFITYRAQVEAAQEHVRIENKRKLDALVVINDRLAAGWDDALVALRAAPRIRVRQPDRCPGTLPAVPSPSREPDAPAAEPPSGSPISLTAEACEQVANDAVIDTANLVWLQEFVRQQHEVTQ